jgi:hypothetical protein
MNIYLLMVITFIMLIQYLMEMYQQVIDILKNNIVNKLIMK